VLGKVLSQMGCCPTKTQALDEEYSYSGDNENYLVQLHQESLMEARRTNMLLKIIISLVNIERDLPSRIPSPSESSVELDQETW
jgi:hypothetical protein